MAKIEKKVKYVIYLDENGKEIERKVKKQGAPPKPHTVDADGNFICTPKPEKLAIESITLDSEGNVVSREPKKQGKGKPGFTKMETGEYAGHWVMQLKAEAETVAGVEEPVAA